MARAKQSSKRKRRKAALVLGAAGVSLTMAGGGVSATAPAANVPSQDAAAGVVLAEEEISDVSLATLYFFDKENASALRQGVRVAASGRGGGGGGCGGCGGCRGCAGCAARSCAAHGTVTPLGTTRGTVTPLGTTRGTVTPLGVTRGTVAPLGTTRGTMAPLGTTRGAMTSGLMHHHRHHGRGCRGCRGCGCGVDVWIGGCYGCAEDYTTCWQWDPDLSQWIYVCE
jgi:hypothetical protein